ncbi:ABC transporter permease [Sporolactobacillus shoreicorticis]|uniref:ABC transporter permease n=1 Tax=Sporolactobacillus shoreicorticis TaxID=1923877 RepID=A0ABW5S2Q4_9BACL|nr:ABC transporter permease [Sporolactobacillus shoreicorticis]MCO7124512.1 ABC transporter permease [Sporolactobacillus shoreicorticis]
MKTFMRSLSVENYKLKKSGILWLVAALFLFLTIINLNADSWKVYIGTLTFQYSTIIGSMGFGMITAWVFGREYTDRTFKDLLALPISRSTLIISKFIAISIWCLIITALSFTCVVLLGLLVHIPGFSIALMIDYVRQVLILSLLNLMVATPVALIASIFRGYMLPSGYAFVSLIIAVLFGGGKIGMFIPSALPSLYYAKESLPLISSLILCLTTLLGTFGTIWWWTKTDQR